MEKIINQKQFKKELEKIINQKQYKKVLEKGINEKHYKKVLERLFKQEQEKYDKNVLEKLSKQEQEKHYKYVLEKLIKQEQEELDWADTYMPYASGYLRHKAPSRHYDKLSKRHMNFINFNNTKIENADIFHDEMKYERMKSIENIATMHQTEEILQFLQRNLLINDGYTYPAKWVVTYYLEHEDDLSKPFLRQMEREMGTRLFDNFNFKSFHGWNKVVLDPSQFESEIPLAIRYFRKAKIKFKIWPVSKKQEEEPESRISTDELARRFQSSKKGKK